MDTTEFPVIVAYDGSNDASLALFWGIRAAVDRHRDLRVVIVAPATEEAAAARGQEERWVQSAADAARDVLKSSAMPGAEVVVEHGSALGILLKESRTADHLVVGSRGHGPVEAYRLGSVSQHLAGHAACPVAVVRAAHQPRSRQILVGIDGSPASERALRYAAERAAETGESVLAVHAYQYPRYSGTPLGALASDIDTDLTESAARLAAELVAGTVGDYPGLDLRSTAVVGRPARVLGRLSDDAALVVVGSRGRNPVAELVLGSVAQQVLHRAECPIVVVR